MTPRRPAAAIAPLRRRLLLFGWMAATGVVVARAAQLQLGQAEEWRAAAQDQHRGTHVIDAPRGSILDRDGTPLAVSRERYGVGVDPDALRDRDAAMALLRDVLGISAAEARRVTDPSSRWHVVPGRYDPSIREALEGVRGIYLDREIHRFYPHGDLARGVLGSVIDGEGRGGIEQVFEGLLRGEPGRRVVAKDGGGRPIPGAVHTVVAPRAGADVRLTLDLDLQEIAQDALGGAIDETGARGGDLIVSDPSTGEILAMVSVENGGTASLAAVNTPYEPGSTFKPFTVAALLQHRAATLFDTLDGEGGRWIAPGGRPLADIGGRDEITLADALRLSSNIAVAKAALRLSPGRQYRALRDFGFGVVTGIPLPGEVAGTLRRPEGWTARSPVSLAIGYEAAVTPLQMTMAYGALANGGVLMEPRLVREVRDASGRVVREERPRALRRVVRRDVAEQLGRVLVDVVEDGTGTAARMGTFRVAGKSGTSRAYVSGSGYASGRYFASFVGYFPADDPQLVVFVKLDSPRGSYYGGATAAPVTRATMEAVLAARHAPIDRSVFLAETRSAVPSPDGPVRFASLSFETPGGAPGTGAGVDVLGEPSGRTGPRVGGAETIVVPDVRGLPARVALRQLHAVGLRVRWEGAGSAAHLDPRPGTPLARGDTVRVRGIPSGAPPGRRSGRR